MYIPAMLLTLAVGYWVLTLAKNQSKGIKNLGLFIGAIIMAASLLGLVCMAKCKSGKGMMCGKSKSCDAPMMKRDCPMMGGAPAEAAPQK